MAREICKGCSRPKSVCLCEYMVHIDAPINILILQHPDEQKHPLATVPILHECISNLDVRVGTHFQSDIVPNISRGALLYPAEGAENWDCAAVKTEKGSSELDSIETLVIIDGTWRKAKRIWFENPWLQQMRSVALTGLEQSHYRIRSTKVEGGLSTLESVVYACNYLSKSDRYDCLLKPFEAMVDMQIKKMGIETFNAHYKGQP